MNWLSRLSLGEALRWALVWPAFLLLLGAAATFLLVRAGAGLWVDFQPVAHLNAWLALFLMGLLFLIGPSCVFLVLWRIARRWPVGR